MLRASDRKVFNRLLDVIQHSEPHRDIVVTAGFGLAAASPEAVMQISLDTRKRIANALVDDLMHPIEASLLLGELAEQLVAAINADNVANG